MRKIENMKKLSGKKKEREGEREKEKKTIRSPLKFFVAMYFYRLH